MKRAFNLKIRHGVVFALFTLPLLAFGQSDTKSNTPFIYYYSATDWDEMRSIVPSPNNIEPILLYEITGEIMLRKKSEINKDTIEKIVRKYISDARFDWYNANEDFCTVKTESEKVDEAIGNLIAKDELLSVRHIYTRQVYKDLVELYPVEKVCTYGLTDEISIMYLNDETVGDANALIESMGFKVELDEYNPKKAIVTVPKATDIITAANTLYESGLFLLACPARVLNKKVYSNEPIDVSSLPFFYDADGSGKKTYWYEIVDKFVVKKALNIEKSRIESLIRTYSGDCEIIWEGDDVCSVLTAPERVATAMESLLLSDDVLMVGHRYMDVTTYRRMMSEGLGYPTDFYIDGNISLSFKDNVSEDIRNNVISEYKLKKHSDSTFGYYSVFETSKTSDILSVCQSIYETGYVNWVTPSTSVVVPVVLSSSFTTDVQKTVENANQIDRHYYDLLGRSIESPSGLTIVVTRYSDGTIRTEKKLF